MRKYLTGVKTALLSILFITQLSMQVKAADDNKDGIQFRSITFEQALAASKKEKKAIFIHCYADWCHYCKYMVDSVYPKKEVGDVYNANFICIRMDMEKEGKEMNKTILAHSFPTFLFFDSNAELIHRAAGRRYKFPFLELAKEALDTNRQMRTYKRKYETGTATPFEVQFYFRMQEVAGMDAQLMLDDYLRKQSDSDFTNTNNWKIIYDILKDPTLPVMKRIIGNKMALEAKYGADSVNNKIINLYNSYLMQYVQLLDSVSYEAARKKIMSTKGLDIAEKICAFAELNKYKMKSDWPSYKVEGPKFVDKYAMNDFRRLNEVANVFHERFYNDKEMMLLAERWAKRSVSLADQYKGNDILANISVSLGKKEQAMQVATHAIELAKLENKDYKQTAQLLDYIQKMPQ